MITGPLFNPIKIQDDHLSMPKTLSGIDKLRSKPVPQAQGNDLAQGYNVQRKERKILTTKDFLLQTHS